jgi:hypothetical protein
MSRLREIKRRARGDLHREMSVPALYIFPPGADPVACDVRPWLKTENHMVGSLPRHKDEALAAEPEDRLRFDLAQVPAPRRLAIVSIETGEAYRIDFLYPVDLGYQTARVLRLSANEATDLPVPS